MLELNDAGLNDMAEAMYLLLTEPELQEKFNYYERRLNSIIQKHVRSKQDEEYINLANKNAELKAERAELEAERAELKLQIASYHTQNNK